MCARGRKLILKYTKFSISWFRSRLLFKHELAAVSNAKPHQSVTNKVTKREKFPLRGRNLERDQADVQEMEMENTHSHTHRVIQRGIDETMPPVSALQRGAPCLSPSRDGPRRRRAVVECERLATRSLLPPGIEPPYNHLRSHTRRSDCRRRANYGNQDVIFICCNTRVGAAPECDEASVGVAAALLIISSMTILGH